jgi:peptidoglycan/LPS O-acetylase OafA/YrhL
VEVGAVLVGFPALVAIAAGIEPSARTGRLFAFLGLMSYGVYILHQPLGNMAHGALRRWITIPGDVRGLAFGAVFLTAVLGLAWWLDVYYDAPLRKWLRGRLMTKT